MGVYLPNWFNIKVNSKRVEGPRHLLFQLQLLRRQQQKVVEAVWPTMATSAWYAHPEAVLQAMLRSDEEEERSEAVKRTVQLRGEGNEEMQVGNGGVRPRRTPAINPHAEKLFELIDLSKGLSEPLLTCPLAAAAVKQFVSQPMEVPNRPSHTQSVERCVRLVTEAAAHVFGREKRDGRIRSQVVSRGLMNKNRTKRDLASHVLGRMFSECGKAVQTARLRNARYLPSY